jgi:hypothetical protein
MFIVLCSLTTTCTTPGAPEAALASSQSLDRALLHRRLGHLGKDLLEQAIKHGVADGLKLDSSKPLDTLCVPCIHGKHQRNPFPNQASHCSNTLLGRVHSELHQVPVAIKSLWPSSQATATGSPTWTITLVGVSLCCFARRARPWLHSRSTKRLWRSRQASRSSVCMTTRVASSLAMSGTLSCKLKGSSKSTQCKLHTSRTAWLSARITPWQNVVVSEHGIMNIGLWTCDMLL